MTPAAATPDEPALVKAAIRHTFNQAAPLFDDDALFFWSVCGRRTVELAGISPGDRVLDVCCGTGASALPAAAAVGPEGEVLGVDLAEEPLGRARAKAAAHGLANTRFAQGDMDRLDDIPDGSQNAVVCVLGLYFARDLAAALAELWRVVAPGGVLAITTWGPRALEPANTLYLDAVGRVRPDLRPASLTWARINQPDLLAATFLDAGIPRPVIEDEVMTHPSSPDEIWTIIRGSGYRLLLDLMGPTQAAEVHARLMSAVVERGVDELISDLLYARARKPVGGEPVIVACSTASGSSYLDLK